MNRIFYVAKHSLHGEEDTLIETFSGIISKVNSEYCAEKLTGFLLTYENYFVHMVEVKTQIVDIKCNF